MRWVSFVKIYKLTPCERRNILTFVVLRNSKHGILRIFCIYQKYCFKIKFLFLRNTRYNSKFIWIYNYDYGMQGLKISILCNRRGLSAALQLIFSALIPFSIMRKSKTYLLLREIWSKTVNKSIERTNYFFCFEEIVTSQSVFLNGGNDEKFGPRSKKFGHPCYITKLNLNSPTMFVTPKKQSVSRI